MKSLTHFSCKRFRTLAEIAARADQPLALAIGVFDGVHTGHRKLLTAVGERARELGALPVALTFDPHPRAVLHPAAPPVLLISLEARCAELRQAGMSEVAVAEFTPEFARTEPEDFLATLLERVPHLAAVGVGAHWRFGAGGRGNAALVAEYGKTHGWETLAVPELEMGGEVVSASRIRRAIAGGDFTGAATLLGRPVTWSGVVAGGYHVAATHLGCPTANVEPEAGVLPPDGVYAGVVTTPEGHFAAAVNVGVAPTYGRREGRERRIEAHLLDYSGDLYGSRVQLELLQYLRSERCFASEAELKTQIERDVAEIRRSFAAQSLK